MRAIALHITAFVAATLAATWAINWIIEHESLTDHLPTAALTALFRAL